MGTVGLKVKPQKGKVVLFYNMSPEGKLDPSSLHGGCRVLSQNTSKWSANFWVWNVERQYKTGEVYKQMTQDLAVAGDMVDDQWEEEQLRFLAKQSTEIGDARLDEAAESYDGAVEL